MPTVVAREQGRAGELVLREDAGDYEIIANGMFLMDTRDGRSERLLVRAAIHRLAASGGHVLLGGLGVGFSLAEALADARLARVTVVEQEPVVVDWARRLLGARTGADLTDPRVRCVVGDLVEHLTTTHERYDAICLDVDNGPHWTLSERNRWLYGDAGLAALTGRLADGGALAIWSAARVDAFEARLRERFARVERHEVHVARGEPDVVYAASR